MANQNEEYLVKYLIDNYGYDIIKDSGSSPNIKMRYSIKIDKLLDEISDNKFHKFIKEENLNNYISISSFINFAIENGNTKSTKGKYPEYMNFIFAYYGIKSDGYILDYTNVPEKAIPQRIEYIAIWSIINMINKDKFLSKYKKSYLLPSYQKCINIEDNRYYDLLFEKINIIIEVQEDSFAHANNVNDELKEALVRVRNKRIYYFKINEYKQDQNVYLINTLNSIRDILIQAILTKGVDIRQDYIFYLFKESINSEISSLNNRIKTMKKSQKDGLKHRIEILSVLFKRTDDRYLIDQLFKWKSDALIKNEGHIITIQNMKEFLRIDSKKDEKILIDEIYKNGNYIVVYNDILLDWKGLVEIIMRTSMCDEKMRTILLNYLTHIEEYYEIITQSIQKHYEACLKVDECMINLVDKHYKEKIYNSYDDKIDKLEEKLRVANEENNILLNKIEDLYNNVSKIYNLIAKKASNKKEKETFEVLTNTYNNVKDICEINKYKHLTIQKEENGSIFKQLPDFPIIYSPHFLNRIDTDLFDAICREWKIPDKIHYSCYKKLCFPFNVGRPNNIPYLEIRPDMYHKYGSYLIPYNLKSDSILLDKIKNMMYTTNNSEILINRLKILGFDPINDATSEITSDSDSSSDTNHIEDDNNDSDYVISGDDEEDNF